MINREQLLYLLLIAYLAVMFRYFYTHQYYNWDIEAYMGIIYKTDNPAMPIEEIHRKVYDELREKAPERFDFRENEKEETIGANSYYKALSENPKAYEEELQFFTVKPMYNIINVLFYKTGFSAATSTFLISMVSYVAIVFFLFGFLQERLMNKELAFVITVLLSLFKPLLVATRHAAPDMLACLLLLTSVYFFAGKKKVFFAAFFATLTVFTRPEYIVFYSLLLPLVLLFRKRLGVQVRYVFLSYIPVFIAFLIVQHYSKIPWQVLFMNQFTKVQLSPVSNPDAFVFSDYVNFIKQKIFLEFNASYFPLLLLFAVIVFGNKKINWFSIGFIFVIYVTVFIRFLIFPSLVDRMMVGFYLLIILTLAVNAAKKQIEPAA